MKNIYIIVGGKGGIGKSVLSFLFAHKHPDAVIYDLDSKNESTFKQLAFMKVKKFSFYSESGDLEKERFFEIITKVTENKEKNILLDCGGGESIAITNMLEHIDIIDLIDVLESLDAKITFLNVISGGDNFNITTDFTNLLYKSLYNNKENYLKYKDKLDLIICKNNYKLYSDFSGKILKTLKEETALDIKEYTLSHSSGESISNTITEMMVSGKG